jgi:formamidopyrimidine-DNA glycosylase
MPEVPAITVYAECLVAKLRGDRLERVRLSSPFLLRTALPPIASVEGQPCPVCGSPVQRIVHADSETNYCARCQTGGKLLADRALSALLKASWPHHIDDIE